MNGRSGRRQRVLYRVLVRIAFFVVIAGSATSSGVLAAEDDRRFIYQWIDGEGGVHITDSLQNVPSEQRSRATRIEQSTPNEKDGSAQVQAPGQPMLQEQAPDAGTSFDEDEIKKAEWQQRLVDARRRLAEAEDRYRGIEERKRTLEAQWGSSGAALPPQSVLDEIAKLEVALVNARKDIDRARNEVEVVIPDAARKAGIPPGWLREVQ
jgi:hypothetical protein